MSTSKQFGIPDGLPAARTSHFCPFTRYGFLDERIIDESTHQPMLVDNAQAGHWPLQTDPVDLHVCGSLRPLQFLLERNNRYLLIFEPLSAKGIVVFKLFNLF
jgi:hypothetical protein